jgi:ABC-type transport system substrate-binding protein
MFEPLLWYNGSSGTDIIPWLAQNYTTSPDLSSYNFTLRSGVTFADGEPVNSSAVYFTLDRMLIMDGSSPTGHGVTAAWLFQQLENYSLSTFYSGPQTYSKQWADEVLAENFVQITGPMTFTIHVQHPNAAFPYIFANVWAFILAPNYVMEQDVGLWNQSATGYALPYPTLTGNMSSRIYEYYLDEIATCNAGATPKGCGATYLDSSIQGSYAGTGPYILQNVDFTTGDMTLKVNPSYWGGPYQFMGGSKFAPQIQTIYVKSVQSETTRELDLENAAKSGQPLSVDISADHLYDVIQRNAWISNASVIPIISGTSVYGPYPLYAVSFDPFGLNVTNPLTGSYYKFQPFADRRIRLAVADSINLTEINLDINNKLGQVANGLIPPGLPPVGSYNASLSAGYSFNLTATQDLLVDAMMHPLTSFTFKNGTEAPSGYFNNTFGCPTLSSSGTCSNPVSQTIQLAVVSGDTLDQDIDTDIASMINNISSTYNMGLSVQVLPLPSGGYSTEEFSSELYFPSGQGWIEDYPWSTDFTGAMFAPGGSYSGPGNWNLTEMGNLNNQATQDSASGNNSGLVIVTNLMSELANQEVMYIWTFYPEYAWPNSVVGVFTSNVHGYYNNPELNGMYWALLYVQ